MRPLRIAQVAPLWAAIPPASYGGTERIVNLLAEELGRLGHEVTLFASGDSTCKATLVPMCERNLSDAMDVEAAHDYEYYATASIAEALKRSRDFDLIHCHLGTSFASLVGLSQCPVLFTAHIPLSCDDQWILRRTPDLPLAFISEYQKRGAPSMNCSRVIPHGIDVADFTFQSRRGEYLAFLARMGPQKNPVGAIEIARRVGMPILLAGKPQNGSEEEYFASEVLPLVDGKDVTYVGAVEGERKNEFLGNAAALVFPIQGPEAFGLSMIEAMACGTPVVGTAAFSVPEIVDFGISGYYADSLSELADLVPAALKLDRLAVRNRFEQRFSKQRMVEDYLRFYQELGAFASQDATLRS